MSALVDAYLAHLAVERRLSPNTVESYGRDLAQLSAAAAALERPIESLAGIGLLLLGLPAYWYWRKT